MVNVSNCKFEYAGSKPALTLLGRFGCKAQQGRAADF